MESECDAAEIHRHAGRPGYGSAFGRALGLSIGVTMDTVAVLHRRVTAGCATLVVLGLLAVGCSSSSSSSDGAKSSDTSSSTTASGKTDSTKPPACPSKSEVDATLKAGLETPSDQLNGSIRTCTYHVTSGGDDVVIRFETGVSPADFTATEQSPGPSGEVSTPVAGIGDSAYTMKKEEPGSSVTVLAVLSGTTEVSVEAPVDLALVTELANKLLQSI